MFKTIGLSDAEVGITGITIPHKKLLLNDEYEWLGIFCGDFEKAMCKKIKSIIRFGVVKALEVKYFIRAYNNNEHFFKIVSNN